MPILCKVGRWQRGSSCSKISSACALKYERSSAPQHIALSCEYKLCRVRISPDSPQFPGLLDVSLVTRPQLCAARISCFSGAEVPSSFPWPLPENVDSLETSHQPLPILSHRVSPIRVARALKRHTRYKTPFTTIYRTLTRCPCPLSWLYEPLWRYFARQL